MSLVAGPSVPVLERHLQRAGERESPLYPAVLGEMVDASALAERYRALADWHAERGHFWVSNGPFLLDSVHPVAGSLVLERFADFPDPGDKWLGFSRPMIPELDLDGPLVVATSPGTGGALAAGGGEGREVADFRLALTFEGEPYPREAIEEIQYLLFDGRRELVGRGRAEPAGEGSWRIQLSHDDVAALGVGANSLELAVTSRRVALPAFASHVFATVPPGGMEETP
jgi:peptide/nickel transport system substrate-binding protein